MQNGGHFWAYLHVVIGNGGVVEFGLWVHKLCQRMNKAVAVICDIRGLCISPQLVP